MDIRCYCSSIKQYETDIKALNSAIASLENAGDQLYKLITQAKSYSGSFAGAAAPENLNSICTEMEICGKKPYLSVDEEIDELDDIISQLQSTHDSMVTADREYHNRIADASDQDDINPNTVPSRFIVSSRGTSQV